MGIGDFSASIQALKDAGLLDPITFLFQSIWPLQKIECPWRMVVNDHEFSQVAILIVLDN